VEEIDLRRAKLTFICPLSLKRMKRQRKLVMANIKSYMGFGLLQKCLTLNDLCARRDESKVFMCIVHRLRPIRFAYLSFVGHYVTESRVTGVRAWLRLILG